MKLGLQNEKWAGYFLGSRCCEVLIFCLFLCCYGNVARGYFHVTLQWAFNFNVDCSGCPKLPIIFFLLSKSHINSNFMPGDTKDTLEKPPRPAVKPAVRFTQAFLEAPLSLCRHMRCTSSLRQYNRTSSHHRSTPRTGFISVAVYVLTHSGMLRSPTSWQSFQSRF